jgi:HlyD family secretion protein
MQQAKNEQLKFSNDEVSPEKKNYKNHDLTLKQQAGDAANRWLEKNRSLVLRQTPVWAQSLAFLLIGLGSIALVGSILFRIDEVVTVQGQLKSIGGTVEVKTPAGGLVADVLFDDGDVVKKGQPLLRFDTRQAVSEKTLLTGQIDFETKKLEAQLSTIESQQATLLGRETVLKQRLKTKITMLKAMESLVNQGGFQRLQYLERKDQLLELQNQANELAEQQSRLKLEAKKVDLASRQAIDRMKTSLKKSELQIQYQNILSPVDGIVFDPKARVEGVLSSGERILSIVPQAGLYAEVYISNKDIGYIKSGQQAKVRVDAFPFTRYGYIAAEVTQIAADALPPDATQGFYRFPVKLRLDRPNLSVDGVKIPLKAGMSITTNLKLRDKRVISLVSDIFVDQTDSIRSLRQQ